MNLTLRILKETMAVCRLPAEGGVPKWALDCAWYTITKTEDEMSVVCGQEAVPEGVTVERDWRCLKIEGVLDFSMVGILSKITGLLALSEISVFAISTYNTDYVFVKEEKLNATEKVLTEAGYTVK